MTNWSIGTIQDRGRFAVLLATAHMLDVLAAIGLIAPPEADVAPAVVVVGGHRPRTADDRRPRPSRCGL